MRQDVGTAGVADRLPRVRRLAIRVIMAHKIMAW
jgi:hypothetical protein